MAPVAARPPPLCLRVVHAGISSVALYVFWSFTRPHTRIPNNIHVHTYIPTLHTLCTLISSHQTYTWPWRRRFAPPRRPAFMAFQRMDGNTAAKPGRSCSPLSVAKNRSAWSLDWSRTLQPLLPADDLGTWVQGLCRGSVPSLLHHNVLTYFRQERSLVAAESRPVVAFAICQFK